MDANQDIASFVSVPEPLVRWSTGKVLMLEWMEGDRLQDLTASATSSTSKTSKDFLEVLDVQKQAGTRSVAQDKERALRMVAMGVESSLSQLLTSGVMHADPHPGNMLYSPSVRSIDMITWLRFLPSLRSWFASFRGRRR